LVRGQLIFHLDVSPNQITNSGVSAIFGKL